jgi:hypothetical protein
MAIHIIEHIYNPKVSYIPISSRLHQQGEIAYTHADTSKASSQDWPYTTQVTITVQSNERTYTIRGTVIGPRHVLTSGFPIYTSHGWAQEVTVVSLIDNHPISVDRAYTFPEWREHKDFRYNLSLLILHKSLGKITGFCGVISVPDSHLKNEEIYTNQQYTLQKIEPNKVHYYPQEKPLTGTSLQINRWKTSLIIGIECQGLEGDSYALRLTPYKVATIAKIISQIKHPSIAFGKKDWSFHFGDIGEEPPLPFNIHEILKAKCPIWPGKRVSETHLLTLIPKTVNGQPLTLGALGELVKNPLQGSASQFRSLMLRQYQDLPPTTSYWTLLTRDVIPDSRAKTYHYQQELVNKYRGYEVPHVLDTAVALFMEHVRNGNRRYSAKTFTRCQEQYSPDWQLVVGGFADSGLCVDANLSNDGLNAVGAARRFE